MVNKKNRKMLYLVLIIAVIYFLGEGGFKGTVFSIQYDPAYCESGYLDFICFENVDDSIPTDVYGNIDIKDVYSDDNSDYRYVYGIMPWLHHRGSLMRGWPGLNNNYGFGRLYYQGYGWFMLPVAGAPGSWQNCQRYRWRPDIMQCFNDQSTSGLYKRKDEVQLAAINEYTWLSVIRTQCLQANCQYYFTNKIGDEPENYNIIYNPDIIGGYNGYEVTFDAETYGVYKSFKFYIVINQVIDSYNLDALGTSYFYFDMVQDEIKDFTMVLTTDGDLANVPSYMEDPWAAFQQNSQEVQDFMNMFKYPNNAQNNKEKQRYYYAVYNYLYNIIGSNKAGNNWGTHEVVIPGGGYAGQWIWDSFFSAWGLAAGCKDNKPECLDMAKDWVQVFKENQLPNGMWPRQILEFSKADVNYQSPGGWPFVLYKIYEKDGDSTFLCSMYQSMKEFHGWVKANKDGDNDNRFRCSSTDEGWDHTPRIEGTGGLVECIDLEGWMTLDAEYLGKIAEVCAPGDVTLWNTRLNDYRTASSAFWDDTDKMFYDIYQDTETPTINTGQKVLSPAIFWLMLADVPMTAEQETAITSTLDDYNKLGVANDIVILPTIARDPTAQCIGKTEGECSGICKWDGVIANKCYSSIYNSTGPWDGATWPNVNLVAWLGLQRKGYTTYADMVRQYTFTMFHRSTLPFARMGSESYNSENAGIVKNVDCSWCIIPYQWSDATYIAMMQDWNPWGAVCANGEYRGCPGAGVVGSPCEGVQQQCVNEQWEACVYGAGYESIEITCDDTLDNDCDTYTDMDDTDCVMPVCDNDNVCETGETCSNCPNDCLSTGQVCCNDVAYTGDCCVNADCLTGYTCQSNVCTEEICIPVNLTSDKGCVEGNVYWFDDCGYVQDLNETCTTECINGSAYCVLPTCGDGTIDSGEDCDLSDLNSKACTDLNNTVKYMGGDLTCTEGCKFNITGCDVRLKCEIYEKEEEGECVTDMVKVGVAIGLLFLIIILAK